MVYTDKTHLIADSLSELHSFAENIGLRREWFQNHRKPHYDIFSKTILKRAQILGVKIVTSKELIEILNKR